MKQLKEHCYRNYDWDSPTGISQSLKINIDYLLLNWPRYISDLKRAMGTNDYSCIPSSRILQEIEILVIDDLGCETPSNWMLSEVLLPILDYRFNNKLFTCFTSNFSITELEKYWLKKCDIQSINRCLSRIRGVCSEKELVGEDKRVFKNLERRDN
ncbi:MAG: hypothetical protein OHM56_02990 [Spiroplasma phoeniceum]|nr:MAG: hypothetical protein OHM57_02440 [Spiroplasma phoeniceum]UZQ32931.1 MAG: hypothetical protein OHM56_02990 [Spiroplasma phoeniceum]